MKTINTKKNIPHVAAHMIDLTDRQPCWYANFENETSRSKARWTVGLKKPGEEKEEYSFKASKAGSVSDETFWSYVSSVDFAIELIDKYRDGGKRKVNEWIKNKCPRRTK